MGFFGLETVPRLGEGAASLRRMGEVERCLACALVRWTTLRARERQRVIVVVESGWFGVGRRWSFKSSRVSSRPITLVLTTKQT